ncbi:titin isoform X2 [Fopius arisanus]|uniref:Titin isoform X2 n=1 Tax=Fopius arisanus TaxID=64838 RepID=A0A0C9RLX2_9HYME|nr:PREDICTED: titin isoform X2 [Fopius arisanus]XP_011312112.1 PREDICTED: titin isoform X2 [Fopius arisanus]
MEKDQLDSLATVAVGSEKIPPPHSHYAPSEVYSPSESPPAYSRPVMKSTAVQIARIVAVTLIAMSLIIGSFILAAAFLEARASCTPESIAAMQVQLNNQQGESFRKLQPEALVQEPQEAKESLQTLSAVAEKEFPVSPKDEKKSQKEDSDTTKPDNESGDENENDDDYEDPEFPPVHIKLPLQLDLDDLAGTLMQQAKNLVSCVVERRRSELTDGDNNLESSTNDPKKLQKLRGERVTILCESGEPNRQEQEQDLLTPIIVPLGPIPMPMQQRDQDYHRYQVPNQFPVPENQRPPFNFRGIHPMGAPFSEFKSGPQLMEMGSPRIQPRPQMDIRPVPFEFRRVPIEMIHGMRPPSDQEHQQNGFHQEQSTFRDDPQPHGMIPPPPPPPSSQELPQEHRMMPQVIIRQQMEQRSQPQEGLERPVFPFQGIPLGIRRIIEQVPLEIKNIIQHITGEAKPVPVPVPVPEGARREPVQDFKPFPEGPRPIPLDSLMLPVEVRNLLEHGNIEGRHQEDSEEQQDQAKPFPGPEDQGEEEEKKFPVPADVRNFIHQIVEGRAFPVARFPLPLRSIESLDVPMEVNAQVMESSGTDENKEQQQEEQQTPQQPQAHALVDTPELGEEKRPHS